MTQSPSRPDLPRLSMVRELTDRTVLDCVYATGRVTRVDVARLTGISKPTISEAVRRLSDAGLLVETGSVPGRPGRVATIYELAPTAGRVLALHAGQEGVRARCVDLSGRSLWSQTYLPKPAGTTTGVVDALRAAVIEAQRGEGPVRSIAVSVANPVDPSTSEIVALPHSPFPEGLVHVRGIFDDLGDAEVLLDNDVNLAALAERSARADTNESFAYLYAGAGLGMACCIGGHVIRGANGLAGEIGYLPDAGRFGPTLADRFAHLGLMRPGTTTIDVERSLEGLRANARIRTVIGDGLASAVAATCAVVDPGTVVLAGPIGSEPVVVERVRDRIAELMPVPVAIGTTVLGDAGPLLGAVQLGLRSARASLVG
jgi:predicted NBD/HSP70 family sugar kinase